MNSHGRIFRSILKPPSFEEIARRQYPLVDLLNQREQRIGQAVCQIEFWDGAPEVIYQMIIGCGDCITHWRWINP